jgi:DNA polymerase-3 subunit gamma/tau
VEIDAASNRGIDEIRSLRERVNYAANIAHYKVYIIDEVHMLTEAASNALLKTLEEPPPHVIFVLATTEPHKVISTIVSRCQRFNFCRLGQAVIADKLNMICQKEGIQIEPESLRVIARAATGSLRDAENLMQQLVGYYGRKVDFDQVQAMLGLTGDSRVKQLARHVANKDISAGLQVINSVNNDGIDLRSFNRELVEYFRGLLLAKSNCGEVVDVTGEDLQEMNEIVASVELDYLLKAIKLFAGIDFRSDSYSALPLEIALVDCVLSSASGQPVSNTPSESAKATVPQSSGEFDTDTAPLKDNVVEGGEGINYVRARWKEFINSLKGEGSNGNLDAFLRSACEPVAVDDDTLVLGFYYAFHKEKIEDPKYRHLVERKLKEVFSQPSKIRCTLVERKKEVPSQAKAENPLIKAAIELGAKIVD